MNSLPEKKNLIINILSVLQDGAELHRSEISTKIRNEFYSDLPIDLLNKKHSISGSNILIGKIHWGLHDLKKDNCIENTRRGYYQITQTGKDALNSADVTLANLQNEKSDETIEDKIQSDLEELEKEIKKEIQNLLYGIEWHRFEWLLLNLLKSMGYGDPVATPRTRDGGIDGIILQDELGFELIVIQAKRYSKENKIGEKFIREFIGAMSGKASKGIFVTTSSFRDDARKAADEANVKIILIDGEQLSELMYKHNVGVKPRKITIKNIDPEYFDNLELERLDS